MISDDRINQLLETLARDGSLDERLLLVDSLTRLPLSDQAWRKAAAPLNECLSDLLESSKQPEEYLPVFARVPLMSVRSTLRGITRRTNFRPAVASALALASQHDGEALPFLLEELARNPSEAVAYAIACMPADNLSPAAAQLRTELAHPDPMVRLWVTIALAKGFRVEIRSRDLEPFEQLWDSLVRAPRESPSHELIFVEPPPLFQGSPWIAAGRLAETRPMPETVKQFLLGLKQNDYDEWNPRSSETLGARNAKILIAGLTGEYDTYGDTGTHRVIEKGPEPLPGVGPLPDLATMAIERWLRAPAPEEWLPRTNHDMSAVPGDLGAAVVERVLGHAPPSDADKFGAWQRPDYGNEIVEFVSGLPAQLPLRISRIVDELPGDLPIPGDVVAWVLARGGPENVWESLATGVLGQSGSKRRESLQWLQRISSQIDAPAPFKGAGGDAGGKAQVQLLNDKPEGTTRGSGGQRAKPPLPSLSARPPQAAPSPQMAPPPPPPPPHPPPMPESAGAEPPDEPGTEERFIQGVLSEMDGTLWRVINHTTLLVGEHYKLAVMIGPKLEGTLTANLPFADSSLDWRKVEVLTLELVFAVLDGRQDAHVAQITLPRSGSSTEALFFFIVNNPGVTRIRISVLHEGRIIQTAILSAFAVTSRQDVTGSPMPEPEMAIYGDLASLEGRRTFDASLLLNETPQGLHTATAAGGGGAYIASLDDSQSALADISTLLQEIATQSKVHTRKLRSEDNAAWLVRLAQIGQSIYANLVGDYVDKSDAAKSLRDARYLQIVTATPDAIVPLEFAYEYGYPDDDAELCDGAEEALAKRACPASCKLKQNPSGHVCPMGFWGLNRVIERHAHDPSIGKEAIIKGEREAPSKGRIALRGISLLAASNQVSAASVEALSKRLAELSGVEVAQVSDWKQWLLTAKKRPNLFVVLPHTHGTGATIKLEIGGTSLASGALNTEYIYPTGSTGSQPIVLLLGCNTAGVADKNSYARHITAFRRANSAIVLATTAEVVWGDDIAEVAGILVDRLHAVAKDSSEHFGDILRDAKCDAVLQSQLVAICLAGVGDADWRITQ